MKKLLSLLLAVMMVFALTAASAEPAARVAGMKGPTAMGMVKMMQDDAGETYDFNVIVAIDEINTKLVKGELDIAAVPANVASVLYNKTKANIQVLAINTLGVLYIVENGVRVRRDVETGATTAWEVQIKSGLEEGEIVYVKD